MRPSAPIRTPRSVTARRRASQRGSLIVEMLVVTPLFAMLCGFSFWFFQVHTANMSVYRKVREPVWETATFGCGEGGETSASFPGPQGGVSIASDGPPQVEGADFSEVEKDVPGGPNNDAITRSVDRSGTNTSEALAGQSVPGFIVTPDVTFRTAAKMMCNEKVEDGQLDKMKRLAAAVFRK